MPLSLIGADFLVYACRIIGGMIYEYGSAFAFSLRHKKIITWMQGLLNYILCVIAIRHH